MRRKTLNQMRGSIAGTLSALYGIIIGVLGLALPVTHFLSGDGIGYGLYLSIFHIYIYVVSLVFLVYVHVSLFIKKSNQNSEDLTDEDRSQSANDIDSPSDLEGLSLAESHDTNERHFIKNGATVLQEEDCKSAYEEKNVAFAYAARGVNFFLRLGLILFAMGSVILDGFRLLQFVEKETAWFCYGRYFIAHTLLRLIFVFSETFFIFKNHRIILNFKRPLMKWGLLHLLATNVSIWGITLVLEVAESATHYQEASTEQVHRAVNNLQIDIQVHTLLVRQNLTGAICHPERTLADEAAPFLYPFSIQLNLIAAAAIYKIFHHVGRMDLSRASRGWIRKHHGRVCHKATTGLFLGMFFLTFTFIGSCFFLIYGYSGANILSPLSLPVTLWVYVSNDAALLLVCLCSVLLAFCQITKLEKAKRQQNKFNQYLLFCSLVGYYAMIVFLIVPAISSLGKEYDQVFVLSQLGSGFISFVQSTLQVALIVDGMRRNAVERSHLKTKPGRSSITFLLICNLSMFFLNTLVVQELHSNELYRHFYGDLTWQIMMHLCLPFVTFYRFHSAVCLSDIWLNAYRREQYRKGKQSKISDSEQYT